MTTQTMMTVAPEAEHMAEMSGALHEDVEHTHVAVPAQFAAVEVDTEE